MKVFLLRACAYQKDFAHLINVYNCRSIIFYDFKEALKIGKAILIYQIQELYKTSQFKNDCKKADDEFIDYCVDYIFEIEETDFEKQKNWREEDNQYWEIENPYLITWDFDHKGTLRGRWFSAKPKKRDLLQGFCYAGCDYRPEDEKPDAGTHFKAGDIVQLKCKQDKIYVIGAAPLKEGKYFENYYTCYYIREGQLTHTHLHESDIEIYFAEVIQSLLWLSKYFKGEIKISEQDTEKIFNGEYSFDQGISYKDIKLL